MTFIQWHKFERQGRPKHKDGLLNRGVLRQRRAQKRKQAEQRAEAYGPVKVYACGHRHSQRRAAECSKIVLA